MIPNNFIVEWRNKHAPWINASQVEHDLVLTRALVDIYNHPLLFDHLAFRGGTALHKLYVKKSKRFSEDLDFVLTQQKPVGEIMSAIRSVLDP